MKTVLSISNLSKSYKDFTLDNISLTIKSGEIMGLVGENGAGKTTLIKLILSAIGKDDGIVEIFGKDNLIYEEEVKSKLGVVFDECCFDDTLDPMTISKIMKSVHKEWDNEVFLYYLRQMKLPLKKRIFTFSKGMKAKLNIAISLSSHPRLLILDEPTSGLDPIVRDEILSLFHTYIQSNNASVLFSSHITSDIEKIADSVSFLHEGHLILSTEKNMIRERLFEIEIPKGDFDKVNKNGFLYIMSGDEAIHILIDSNICKDNFYQKNPITIEKILLFIVNGQSYSPFLSF